MESSLTIIRPVILSEQIDSISSRTLVAAKAGNTVYAFHDESYKERDFKQHIGIVQKFASVASDVQRILDRVPLKNIKIRSYRTDIMISMTRIRITVHF